MRLFVLVRTSYHVNRSGTYCFQAKGEGIRSFGPARNSRGSHLGPGLEPVESAIRPWARDMFVAISKLHDNFVVVQILIPSTACVSIRLVLCKASQGLAEGFGRLSSFLRTNKFVVVKVTTPHLCRSSDRPAPPCNLFKKFVLRELSPCSPLACSLHNT